jgi:hypothetical protein
MVLAPEEGKKSVNKGKKRAGKRRNYIIMVAEKSVVGIWEIDKGNMILGKGWSDERKWDGE